MKLNKTERHPKAVPDSSNRRDRMRPPNSTSFVVNSVEGGFRTRYKRHPRAWQWCWLVLAIVAITLLTWLVYRHGEGV